MLVVQASSTGSILAAQRPRVRAVACRAAAPEVGRRELLLKSSGLASTLTLAALFNIGAAPRPSGLGVLDYGGGVKTLGLCPPSPNCISTSEEANDPEHYVPGWTYNPEDGRGRANSKKPAATQAEAMAELREVVESLNPDKFTVQVVKQTDDYLYAEYTSPTFGFVDDVEFWFKPGPGSRVEYRSASRVGESDGGINRKRIRAIRQALEKKGWATTGY